MIKLSDQLNNVTASMNTLQSELDMLNLINETENKIGDVKNVDSNKGALIGNLLSNFDGIPSLDEVKYAYIDYIYKLSGNNASKSSKILGIARTTFWRLMKEFNESK